MAGPEHHELTAHEALATRCLHDFKMLTYTLLGTKTTCLVCNQVWTPGPRPLVRASALPVPAADAAAPVSIRSVDGAGRNGLSVAQIAARDAQRDREMVANAPARRLPKRTRR